MALSEEEKKAKQERDRIKAERKKLEADQKKRNQEAKKRAKELSKQEAELETSDGPGSMIGILITALFLVVVWIGIFCLLVKLDVGGLGSRVMAPIIGNIPVVKMILPKDSITETEDTESYYGYSSLRDAVDQVKRQETQLEELLEERESNRQQIAALSEEVNRLKTFESSQVDFQRVKTEFYEQVVYSEKGPGAEEFKKYYESMDPETAQYIYRQVAAEEQVSKEIRDYATAYSEMKPKEAAGIFEAMTDDLGLAAKILGAMSSEDRGKILGVMDASVAAKITKIMEPTT